MRLLLILILSAGLNADSSLQRPSEKEKNRPNPYELQPSAEKAGAKLFQRECASCHGQNAKGTRHDPALTSQSLNHAPPGAIFWVLRNGSLRRGMPSFSHLPEQQRWQIVTYLKAARE